MSENNNNIHDKEYMKKLIEEESKILDDYLNEEPQELDTQTIESFSKVSQMGYDQSSEEEQEEITSSEEEETEEDEELPIPFLYRSRVSITDEDDSECEKSVWKCLYTHTYKGIAVFTFIIVLKCAYTAFYFNMFTTSYTLSFIVLGIISYVFSQMAFYKVKTTHPGNGSIEDESTMNCTEQEKKEAKERAQFAIEHHVKCIDIGYPCRYCERCKKFRKPRAYHCKKCNECILERDHHCCWVGSCIGKNNFRYFLQYVYYTSAALAFASVIEIIGLIKHIKLAFVLVRGRLRFSFIPGIHVFFGIIVIGMILALFFSIAYLAMIYKENLRDNMTTMESIEHKRWKKLSEHPYKFPLYDKGYEENKKQIMGVGMEVWNPFVSRLQEVVDKKKKD